ncbi:hypothetical protein [Nonomuraea sp. GTA35]|uniref:hypothetical protein n=1 Tax=Nonomuraea sp. GTA35 TaxID=1676746 RepID=UPI0035C26F07
MSRRIARTLVLAVAYLALDLVEAFACLAAIAALTGLLALALPTEVALAIAVLTVCTAFGYRRARTLARNRTGDLS